MAILNLVSACTCIDACLSYHFDCYPTLDLPFLSHTKTMLMCVFIVGKRRVDMLHTWRLNPMYPESPRWCAKERGKMSAPAKIMQIHIFKPLFLMSTTYSIYTLLAISMCMIYLNIHFRHELVVESHRFLFGSLVYFGSLVVVVVVSIYEGMCSVCLDTDNRDKRRTDCPPSKPPSRDTVSSRHTCNTTETYK